MAQSLYAWDTSAVHVPGRQNTGLAPELNIGKVFLEGGSPETLGSGTLGW